MVRGKESPASIPFRKLNLFRRVYLSALVTGNALFPPCRESGEQHTADQPALQTPHVALTREDISCYLRDFNRTADRQGEIKILFHGCLAFAAPALLFRLKRSGFSNCRVIMTKEGLLLCATR
jgi:hypothetical protein